MVSCTQFLGELGLETKKRNGTRVMAYDLKLKGNELYKQGDYSGAEELYSQAYDIHSQTLVLNVAWEANICNI